MSNEWSITVRFTTDDDDASAAEALRAMIETAAPFMVDNVEVDATHPEGWAFVNLTGEPGDGTLRPLDALAGLTSEDDDDGRLCAHCGWHIARCKALPEGCACCVRCYHPVTWSEVQLTADGWTDAGRLLSADECQARGLDATGRDQAATGWQRTADGIVCSTHGARLDPHAWCPRGHYPAGRRFDTTGVSE